MWAHKLIGNLLSLRSFENWSNNLFRRLIVLIESVVVGFGFILLVALGFQIFEAFIGEHHKFDKPWDSVIGLGIALVVYVLVYGAIRWVITSSPFPYTSLPTSERSENEQ